jgi:hypothetical protein
VSQVDGPSVCQRVLQVPQAVPAHLHHNCKRMSVCRKLTWGAQALDKASRLGFSAMVHCGSPRCNGVDGEYARSLLSLPFTTAPRTRSK